MKFASAYIPMDRRQTLARGETLPNRANGSVLFADISGFTPLTETLVKTLKPKRAAEEITRQLNRVYEALIAEVHRYGGSVIGFVGDAIITKATLPGELRLGTSESLIATKIWIC